MSKYYETVYQKRLNRYGLDYQSRIQNQRERDFDNYLYKTIYRVDFDFNGQLIPASLERYKQDYSETIGYLLTKNEVQIPNGTVLMIESRNQMVTPWMVWWLEHIEASGYNRYIVLKMTHYLKWKVGNQFVEQWAYFVGPGATAIDDVMKTTTGKPIYNENNNLYTFVTALNETISRELYFEVTQGNITQGYIVTGFDVNTTPGIHYVTVDPVPLRETPIMPSKEENSKKEEFYWLGGM